jgi:MerR family transcriptional regulator/heat shock protein HspR
MKKAERAVYMISVVAEMLGVHPQTLRLYEREGFIRPSRTEGGVRLYSERDVDRIRMIINLTREMGVNLAGVEVILSMREKMERLQEEMDRMADEMRRQFMEELKRREEIMRNPLVPAPKGRVIKVKVDKKD